MNQILIVFANGPTSRLNVTEPVSVRQLEDIIGRHWNMSSQIRIIYEQDLKSGHRYRKGVESVRGLGDLLPQPPVTTAKSSEGVDTGQNLGKRKRSSGSLDPNPAKRVHHEPRSMQDGRLLGLTERKSSGRMVCICLHLAIGWTGME